MKLRFKPQAYPSAAVQAVVDYRDFGVALQKDSFEKLTELVQ